MTLAAPSSAPSHHTRWPIFGALVAGVAIVASLWFIVLSDPKGEAVPASGGRYVEGVTRPPERMNPLFASANPTDGDLASLMFSGLVRLAPDGIPQPDLAERWEISGNGTVYVFHLRKGVAWHGEDAAPVTSDDVVFTFRAISDPGFKGDPVLAQLMQGVVVTARDESVVEFRLEQAYAPFLAYLTVGVLPEHLLRDLDANALFNAPFNSQPVGTGPYMYGGRTGDGVVLKANPTYHFGPPHISTLEFRVYDDDSALTEALRGGQIDGALLGPNVPPQDIALLRGDVRFVLHDLQTTSMLMMYVDTRSPLFADRDVRLALVRGLNVRSLIDDKAGGRGVEAATGIATGSWAHSKMEVPGFSPGAAASALEIAGWQRGSDGIRRKGDVRFAFAISTSNDPRRVALAEDIARQWRAIGASVEVQALAADTYLEEHVLARQFEAALVEIDSGPDPDPYPFWHSTQIAPPGRNLSGYSEPAMDDVLERARQTTDVDRRRERYELFQGYLIAAAPAVPLFTPVLTYAQAGQTRGFEPSVLFTPASRFANVNAWYLRTRVE